VQIDPHNKAVIDALVDAEQRQRTRRGWIIWLVVLALSLTSLYLFNHDLVSGWIGTALAIGGVVGILLFLVFLSTKPFGHSDSSYRWWWLR
jgi:hypothetical protein